MQTTTKFQAVTLTFLYETEQLERYIVYVCVCMTMPIGNAFELSHYCAKYRTANSVKLSIRLLKSI